MTTDATKRLIEIYDKQKAQEKPAAAIKTEGDVPNKALSDWLDNYRASKEVPAAPPAGSLEYFKKVAAETKEKRPPVYKWAGVKLRAKEIAETKPENLHATVAAAAADSQKFINNLRKIAAMTVPEKYRERSVADLEAEGKRIEEFWDKRIKELGGENVWTEIGRLVPDLAVLAGSEISVAAILGKWGLKKAAKKGAAGLAEKELKKLTTKQLAKQAGKAAARSGAVGTVYGGIKEGDIKGALATGATFAALTGAGSVLGEKVAKPGLNKIRKLRELRRAAKEIIPDVPPPVPPVGIPEALSEKALLNLADAMEAIAKAGKEAAPGVEAKIEKPVEKTIKTTISAAEPILKKGVPLLPAVPGSENRVKELKAQIDKLTSEELKLKQGISQDYVLSVMGKTEKERYATNARRLSEIKSELAKTQGEIGRLTGRAIDFEKWNPTAAEPVIKKTVPQPKPKPKEPPAEPGMKERKHYETLRESQFIHDEVKKQLGGQYLKVANQKTWKEATDLVASDIEEAIRIVYADEVPDALTTATAYSLIQKYQNTAKAATDQIERTRYFEKAAHVADAISRKLTQMGQATQAANIVSKLSPEGALSYGTKQVRNSISKKKQRELDKTVDEIADKFQKAEKETVEGVIGEVKKTAREAKKLTPEEKLARRISLGGKKKDDPVMDMVNTLHEVAKEYLPQKGFKPPREIIELIGQAIRNRAEYRDVWNKAKELVEKKYADNPEALDILSEYFDSYLEKPFAKTQVEKAVRQEIKAQELKVAEVVRQHFRKQHDARESLVGSLINKAGLSADEADFVEGDLLNKVIDKFNEKKSQILSQMFAKKEKNPIQKSLSQRIIEWSNLGAFYKSEYRDLVAQKLGLPAITEDVAEAITRQADAIQDLPYGREQQKAIQKLFDIIEDAKYTGWFSKYANLRTVVALEKVPQSIMSSFLDISFPGRQGSFLAPSFRREWGRGFAAQRAIFSEKTYDKIMDVLLKDPDYAFAEQMGLSFTDVMGGLQRREETYMTNIAQGLPGIGKIVQATERAFSAGANTMRLNIFKTMIKRAEDAGRDPRNNVELAKEIASFVNGGTGRGDLIFLGRSFEKAGLLLNGLLFSPRKLAGDIQMMNPVYYIRSDKFVRKQHLHALLKYIATGVVILAMADASGLEVGAIPTSANFGKIVLPNGTRIDIWAGKQQIVVFLMRMINGVYTSSVTGEEKNLNSGFGSMTREDVVLNFIYSKEAPVPSYIHGYLKNRNNEDEPYDFTMEALRRFVPMVSADAWDIMMSDPSLWPLMGYSVIGGGLQTYEYEGRTY